MAELIGIIFVVVGIKLFLRYVDKHNKWTHVDQFGHIVWPLGDDDSE